MTMNCPNCKNPIQISSGTCEWCGAQIGTESGGPQNQSTGTSSKPNNFNEMPRGRRIGLIVIAIIVFILIYLQINPIT